MNFLACFLLLSLASWLCIRLLRPRQANLPPGPWPIPVLGNILQLGTKPHQALAKLSKKHGPVMSLKLGFRSVVVISSPAAAQEALQKNDLALSSRSIPHTMTVGDHHKYSLVWLPTAAKWKRLRRVCTVQVFSPQKLDATRPLRQQKADQLLDYLRQCSVEGRTVNVGKAVFTTVLNLMSMTLFSIDFGHYTEDSGSSQEFKELFWSMMESAGTPNISDFFPALRFLDLQGAHRRASYYRNRLLTVFDGIIAGKARSRASVVDEVGDSSCRDVLDSLLDLEDRSELCRNELKALLLDLLVAGVDTSQATIEWAMTELMKNPEKMAIAKAELDQVIGKGVRVVQEPDLARLPYLKAVIKETLRMHPVVPLLLPHKAETQVRLCGFDLMQNTQIMVNVWAMGRDPSVWRDPMRFEPERFVESEVDVKGSHFELIPFGAGRRICPGLPLANRMVPLTVATMIHGFDWELVDREPPESGDNVSEKFGISLQKATPLFATPISFPTREL